MPVYLVWETHNGLMHYAGVSIDEAIIKAREKNVSTIDVWYEGKQLGNFYISENVLLCNRS